MGEAKRRGTLEQRIAQSVVRREAEEARRAEQRRLRAIELRRQASERQKLLSSQERKERVLMAGGAPDTRLLLAMLAGASAAVPLLVLDDAPRGPVDSSSHP